jgi:hypothetical protein
MLLKEIIPVYTEKHTRPITIKGTVTDVKAGGAYSYH